MKLHPIPTNTSIHKERHIVTWTQQEDDILREQIRIHGTENWGIIAAQFKDKTTRQCRRRWYTYLNSDFKKGGWTEEEDMILCEAQKIYGNRWTEIAKVVSGRTDNAVKNRFSTLCKKRAKNEAIAKENNLMSCINQNNKRTIIENAIITNATSESAPPLKKMRTHILDTTENCTLEGRLHIKSATVENQPLRPPFAVLVQNSHTASDFPAQQNLDDTSIAPTDGISKAQGTFLRRDDPRINALMQQAELLSSLALKVNTEKNHQSLEDAWKELQDFLKRNDENEVLTYQISDSGFPFEDLLNLVEESSNMGSLPCWRQPDLYESPGSSGYSTGSTLRLNTENEKPEQPETEKYTVQHDASVEQQSVIFVENQPETEKYTMQHDTGVEKQSVIFVENHVNGCEDGFIGSSIIGVAEQSIPTEAENETNGGGDWVNDLHADASVGQVSNIPSCDDYKENEVIASMSTTGFISPVQATPLFKRCAAAIPSPQFSESERNFLMKTLLGSPTPTPSHNPSQPPPCRRALLHSL